MKVLLVNGGAHPKGCTNRALEEVEKALKEEEIETLIYHIPNVPLQDCIACGTCAKIGKCIYFWNTCLLCTSNRKGSKFYGSYFL